MPRPLKEASELFMQPAHPMHRPNPLEPALFRGPIAAPYVQVEPVIRALREVRLAWGLTQREVAQRIGCHHDTLAHVENGDQDPGYKMLRRWADVLGFELGLKSKQILDIPNYAPPRADR
jgi:DNA-binding XRE family transcriptional regulator